MSELLKFISDTEEGTILSVKLVPNSSYNKITDYTDEYIRVKISSPPVDNRANKELISFFSDLFSINKSKITIISGEKSKLKKVLFRNTKSEEITQKLLFVLDSVNKNN